MVQHHHGHRPAAPAASIADLVFPGGVVTESIRPLFPFPPPLGNLPFTTFHGEWTPTGKDCVEAALRAPVQNVDTVAPVGTDNVRLSLELDRDAGTLAGTFRTRIKAPDGTVLLAASGTYASSPSPV